MRTKVILVLINVIALLCVQGAQKTGDQKNKVPPRNDAPSNDITHDNNVDLSGTETVVSDVSSPSETNIPTNVTETNSTETVEDEEKKEYVNITGTSESLADYVYDLLAHSSDADKTDKVVPSDANATQPSATNASISAVPASSVTSQDSGGAPTEGAGSSPDKEWTGVPVPEEPKKQPTSTSEENLAASSNENIPSPKKDKVNCNTEVDLQNFCSVDEDVKDYFGGDTTFQGLQSPLFNMDIVHRLMSCPSGQWCLEDETHVFNGMEHKFFSGPLCEEAMWECIFDILMQREHCSDKHFMFVVDAVDLVCSMFVNEPKGGQERACFAQALAALHVTYADFLANNMTGPHPEAQASCEGHAFRMTKTYLCAEDVCGALFDARMAMEKFGRWGWFMSKVDQTVADCDLKNHNVCESMQPETTVVPRPAETWFGMTTSSFWSETAPSTSTSYPEGEESTTGRMGEDNMDRLSREDESMMVALSVASAVGLLFMVLGLIFWRRNRRRNLYYYRTTASDGYDKVPSDEAHLLSRSSD